MGVEAVDAHRHHLVAPVDVAQGLDDVLARLRLVVRRDRVLEVEEDDIGRRLGGLLEQLRLGTRDRQFAAIQPGGRLFDDLEAHRDPQLVNGAAS
jgi:hypothetical protein